ncbi:MAG: sec-independent protein translocase protein TatC, partial [Patescibacteria group bacterium]|nr:sec-independent protein translocase protein TatC [Patescibacteria group bacterium]
IYYTTPAGAFGFVIKLSTTFGLIVSLPLVTYQIFSFFLPVLGSISRRHLLTYVLTSVALASLGVLFAYLISLPAALNFLTNFGSEVNIQSLITANEYFNFVLTYLAGFAILFQVPLIILLIDKIKPLSPRKLLGTTKYVILVSFIVSAIITPTPDPFNQAVMAVPVILLYLSTALVMAIRSVTKKRSASKKILTPTTSVPDEEVFSIPVEVIKDIKRSNPTVTNSVCKMKAEPRLISDFIRVPQTVLKV